MNLSVSTSTFHFLATAVFTLLIYNAAPSQAQSRTFTSTEGQTLVAEVVSVEDQTVKLKLANGSIADVPLSRLSIDDLEYLSNWQPGNSTPAPAANPAPAAEPENMRYRFEITAAKDRLDKSKGNKDNVQVEVQTWAYNITVRNLSTADLTNLSVDYILFYSTAEGKSRATRRSEGNAVIESIARNKDRTIATQPVQIELAKLNGSFYYVDGSKNKQHDELEGIVVKLKHNGSEVFAWASAGVPKEVRAQIQPAR